MLKANESIPTAPSPLTSERPMIQPRYKYIYGPVYSWRLGMSLGIDPLAQVDKVCNFDCIYCQLGPTRILTNERKEFLSTKDLVAEIQALPGGIAIDHLTFSGRGEPTLAKNLGEMIQALKKIRTEKVAVLTNAALLSQTDVRNDLSLADFVLAKLDVASPKMLAAIDQAVKGVEFQDIIKGIMMLHEMFTGKLALQIMLLPANKRHIKRIAQVARLIEPDEVQLNTPVRPGGVIPLTREEMQEAKESFKGMNVVSVYDVEIRAAEPFNFKDTIKRHGNYKVTLKS